MEQHDARAAAFTRCWERDAARVAAYARRHLSDARSEDIVAETFAIAWRRWADVPDPPLPWLLRTARNLMSEERRALARRQQLAARIALLERVAGQVVADVADSAFVRERALEALAALSEDQREALLLVAWDGLSITEAAQVLGLRPGAFRARLHRGRAVLETRLGNRPHRANPTRRIALEENR